MAMVKGTDSEGRVSWLREIRNGATYSWDDELHASHMPIFVARNWAIEVNRKNHYLDSDLRIIAEVVEEFRNG